MDTFQRFPSRIVYAGVAVIGVFLTYWGMMSLISVSYVPSVTIPWLDQLLTEAGGYVWIPAAGMFLIVVGISPVMGVGARQSRVVRGVLGGVGVVCLGFGGFFAFLTLSPIYGFIFVAPVFLTAVVLIDAALGDRGPISKGMALA